jgi:4'-phosphopantetheinyl transferase
MRAPLRLELASLQSLEREIGAVAAEWMTPRERQRADAMRAPLRRRQFLAGHWLARRLAAAQSGSTPLEWRWNESDGARRLSNPNSAPLQVSIAHCGEWIACAIHAAPLGIDLELPRRPRDYFALAREIGSSQELLAFEAAPPTERESRFLLLWSLKEARGKHDGTGLRPERAREATALVCDVTQCEASSWQVDDGGSLAVHTGRGDAIEVSSELRLGPRCGWRYAAT